MFILPREHRQIARLFDFLLQGEQLAFDCASQQIHLFEDRASQNFFRNQAHQEKIHYRVFKSGIGILAPKGISGTPGKKAMRSYRQLLEAALQRGDQAETLLGMQVLLEGLGDITLKHIDAGFEQRRLQFLCQRVRHLIVGQEDAHHSFGVRRLQLCLQDAAVAESLTRRSQNYFEILEQLLESVADLFEYFDENPQLYIDEFQQSLPDWLGVRAS